MPVLLFHTPSLSLYCVNLLPFMVLGIMINNKRMRATNVNCYHCRYSAVRETYCGWVPCSIMQKKVRTGAVCFIFAHRSNKLKLR